MTRKLYAVLAIALGTFVATAASAGPGTGTQTAGQAPEALAQQIEYNWHSRWRSHYRWGSGGGAYHNRHASQSHGYAHYHSRWRSHHRWGSRDHGYDSHSRWRSHNRYGSDRHDYHSRHRSHHRWGSHRSW